MSLRVAQASGRGAQCTESALVCPRRSGTGHSRLSLLCRVLAVGRKCAFGATIGIAVNLEPNPCENPQRRSKRDARSRAQPAAGCSARRQRGGGVGPTPRALRLRGLLRRAGAARACCCPPEARAWSDHVNQPWPREIIKLSRKMDIFWPEMKHDGARVQSPLRGAKQHHLSQQSPAVSPIPL